jgi:hypothetical protein
MQRRSNAAGGLGSRQVVERYAPKVEPRARAASPAGAGQIGSALGNHATMSGKVLPGGGVSLMGGPGFEAKGPTRCGEGPGAGRNVHSSGTQAQHGPGAGHMPEPARGILGNKGERQP